MLSLPQNRFFNSRFHLCHIVFATSLSPLPEQAASYRCSASSDKQGTRKKLNIECKFKAPRNDVPGPGNVIIVGAPRHTFRKKRRAAVPMTAVYCLHPVGRGPFMGTGTQVLCRHRMKECLILGLVGPHDMDYRRMLGLIQQLNGDSLLFNGI